MENKMFSYTKDILEKVSFDPKLFYKELQKALKVLLPYEIEQLSSWLNSYTQTRPELKDYQLILIKS